MESLEKICRACLRTEAHEEFTIINSNSNEIAIKFNLVGGITVCLQFLSFYYYWIYFNFQITELAESNGKAFICQSCLKELYQCFLFRKKLQSADEYFKEFFKTRNFSEQQCKVKQDKDNDDLSQIKLEPFVNGPDIAEASSKENLESYEFAEAQELLCDHFTIIQGVEEDPSDQDKCDKDSFKDEIKDYSRQEVSRKSRTKKNS